mgnify:CR=1 FL=1
MFGAYDDSDLYMRNRVLVQALVSLADEATFVRPAPAGGGNNYERLRRGGLSLLARALRHLRSYWRQRSALAGASLVFIPYPAYGDYLLLRLLRPLRRPPVLVDAFLDLYETVVHDRQMVPERTVRARLVRGLERFVLRGATGVLVDTRAQARALGERYGLQTRRISVVPVGLDEAVWRPLPRPPADGALRVIFWGTFIPLHGVATIVAAARRLADDGAAVEFMLIGDGQSAPAVARDLARRPLANLRWQRRLLDSSSLRREIARAHVALGVFGSSAKAAKVVPYKVHQALACNRPMITRDNGELAPLANSGLLLIPAADAGALAAAILRLRDRLRHGEVAETRALYDRHFGSDVVRASLREAVTAAGGDGP